MTKKVRIAIIAGTTLVGLAAAVFLLIDRLVPLQRIKAEIESASAAFLQSPFAIEKLEWRRLPSPALIGYNVRIWDDESKKRLLVESPRIEAQLKLLSFSPLTIGIAQLKFVRPHMTLIQNEQGSWNFSPVLARIGRHQNEKPASQRPWLSLAFNQFAVRDGQLSIENTRFHTVIVASATAQVKLREKLNGNLDTDFDATLVSSPTIVKIQGATTPDAITLSWNAAQVPAEDFFHVIGSSLEVAGSIGANGKIQTETGTGFLPRMNGEIDFSIKNGWFGDVPGLLKILAKLNLRTLITEATGRHKSHVPFDETRGVIEIVNGKASTKEPVVLENKTLQMAFMGSYDLPSDTIDGKIAVHFLTVTDEIIRAVPIVRDILLGKEKGLIPIWVEVKGKASDPDIHVLSTKSITGPVFNTIGNIFRLPKTLFEKLKGSTEPH